MPYNSIGGIPVMEAVKRDINVYAIKENSTVLDVNSENFSSKCVTIDTYNELMEII